MAEIALQRLLRRPAGASIGKPPPYPETLTAGASEPAADGSRPPAWPKSTRPATEAEEGTNYSFLTNKMLNTSIDYSEALETLKNLKHLEGEEIGEERHVR